MTKNKSSRFHKWFRKLFFWYSYFRSPRWDTGLTPPELMEFIELHSQGRALDLGCGTGTNIITLAKQGWQVIGVDFIPTAIRIARKKIEAENVSAQVLVDDVTKLGTISGQFDLIYDIGCYHNLSAEGKRSYEKNLTKFLQLGSTFLLYGFLNEETQEFGISKDDIIRLSFSLVLTHRKDGQDRDRPSSWFEFQYVR